MILDLILCHLFLQIRVNVDQTVEVGFSVLQYLSIKLCTSPHLTPNPHLCPNPHLSPSPHLCPNPHLIPNPHLNANLRLCSRVPLRLDNLMWYFRLVHLRATLFFRKKDHPAAENLRRKTFRGDKVTRKVFQVPG